jgi:hypothetical protein
MDVIAFSNADHAIVCDQANQGRAQRPTIEHGGHFPVSVRFRHQDHPLLAFAEHDLVGRHPGLSPGHGLNIDVDTYSTPAGALDDGAGQPGGSEVLHGHHSVSLQKLKARFHQLLFEEWVAHLDDAAM